MAYTVGDVMTHAVVAVVRQESYDEVVARMRQWRVAAVPVLEGDGRVVGVVAEADLVTGNASATAGELMSSPAVSVPEDARIAEAARTMAWKRVKRMPVVDGNGRLTGVVTRGDLLKVFLRSDEEIAAEIRGEVFGLLPPEAAALWVEVERGVVTVRGRLPDTTLAPLAARLVRSVEGVVDVRVELERAVVT